MRERVVKRTADTPRTLHMGARMLSLVLSSFLLIRISCLGSIRPIEGWSPNNSQHLSFPLPTSPRSLSMWRGVTCAAYLLYVLQLVPALTAHVRYVPVCTAHLRTVRHTRDNKGYKAQKEKGNQIHRRDHISRVHSHPTLNVSSCSCMVHPHSTSLTPSFGYPG